MESTATSVKMSLKKFLIEGTKNCLHDIIQHDVIRLNNIITEAYHLIYLHSLRLLSSGCQISPFNKYRVLQFLLAVSSKENERIGRKRTIDKDIEKTKQMLPEKQQSISLSRNGIGHFLQEAATDMMTAINNNIIIHFKRRQWKILKLLNPSKKNNEIKKIQKEINSNNNDGNDGLFHPQLDLSFEEDLRSRPEAFLRSLWLMNKKLEEYNDGFNNNKNNNNDNNNNNNNNSNNNISNRSPYYNNSCLRWQLIPKHNINR